MAEYQAKVNVLWDTLMGLELQLVDQLEVGLLLVRGEIEIGDSQNRAGCL